MSEQLIEATVEASQKWKNSFNAGSAEGCAAMYEMDAVMEAKPFGVFKGREAIQTFWADLIEKGFAEVDYIEPNMQIEDDTSVVLSSRWKMNNAHGVITRELWVRQGDGSMLLRDDRFEVQG